MPYELDHISMETVHIEKSKNSGTELSRLACRCFPVCKAGDISFADTLLHEFGHFLQHQQGKQFAERCGTHMKRENYSFKKYYVWLHCMKGGWQIAVDTKFL